MKNKTSLVLMEQLVLILVFSLAAALCLQTFSQARNISLETIRLDRAVILAQNGAQLLKATDGDAEKAESLSTDDYRVIVRDLPETTPGLGRAEIQVFFEETLLFSLETGWQEELP